MAWWRRVNTSCRAAAQLGWRSSRSTSRFCGRPGNRLSPDLGCLRINEGVVVATHYVSGGEPTRRQLRGRRLSACAHPYPTRSLLFRKKAPAQETRCVWCRGSKMPITIKAIMLAESQ
jgi:hypothetical protein